MHTVAPSSVGGSVYTCHGNINAYMYKYKKDKRIYLYIIFKSIHITSRLRRGVRNTRVGEAHPTMARGTPHTNGHAGGTGEGGISDLYTYMYKLSDRTDESVYGA